MKKLLCILPLLAILLSSCSEKSKLIGTLPNNEIDGKKVYLLTKSNFDAPFLLTDSAVIENGQFKFELNDSVPLGVGQIIIRDAPQFIANQIPFVYEKGEIKIAIDTLYKISGTPLNDKSQIFWDKFNVVAKKGTALGERLEVEEDENARQTIMQEMIGVSNEASSIIFSFVKENIQNPLGEYYFVELSQAFDENQVKQLLDSATPEFRTKVGSSLVDQSSAESPSFVDKEYINLTGKTPEGKTISLSDYVSNNKLTLVDFWASWCGPCIKEMPNLVKAYDEFKNKGFEIVGVSLDDDKNKWVKGILELNITWAQMSDLKGWNSDLSKAYDVKGIPFTVLIDQSGKIIAQDLRGKELDILLKDRLK